MSNTNPQHGANASAAMTTAQRVQRIRRVIETRSVTWPQVGDDADLPHGGPGALVDSDTIHVCEALARANALIEHLQSVIQQAVKHHQTTSLPLAIANYGSRELAGEAGAALWRTQVPQALARVRGHLNEQGFVVQPAQIQTRAERALGSIEAPDQTRSLSPSL